MNTKHIAGAAALAFVSGLALTAQEAAAKPISMCFKTGNGRNFVQVNRKDGYLIGNATACAGDAVFSVDDASLNPRVPARVAPPVVIKAANGRYVQYYGARLRATAPTIKRGDTRFMYLLRPSHGGIKLGAPLAANMKLNAYPVIGRGRLMMMAPAGGGRDVRHILKRNPRDPQVFFSVTPASGAAVAKALALPWKHLPGAALDIGVGGGQAWVIGTDQGIYRWDGKTWGKVPGAAVRIAVGPRGLPWVVNKAQEVYRFNGKGWQKMPVKAFDIAIDASGVVYVISDRKNGNDYDIYRLAGGKWVKFSGNSTRIAAGPAGVVVASDASGATHVFSNGKWSHLPGRAMDVGMGANGVIWKVAPDKTVHRWAGKQWVHHVGGLVAVAADAKGMPWGVAPNNGIYAHANSATLTPKSLPKAVDPKLIAALKKKLGALKSALARYQTTAKAYLEKAKTLQQQEKNIAVLYKKTEAQLKSAMGR